MQRITTSSKTRIKTASNSYRNENIKQKLESKCKSPVNTIFRFKPLELDYNEALGIIGVNNIKHVRPPTSRKIKIYPTIIPKNEFQRIKENSKYVNVEEKFKKLHEADMKKKQIEDECEKRKKILKEYDDARLKAKLEQKIREEDDDNLDEELKNERIKILDRAFLAKHENEEEVKKANQLILAAKCHVIREAQIIEKNELEKELKEEDLKLEKMMIEERDKAFKEEEEKLNRQNELKSKYIKEIKNQLQERELRKLISANQIEEEARIRAQAAAIIQQDEERKMQIKKEKQEKLRHDLRKAAENSAFLKKMEFEEQQQAELKISEYMKQKEQREQKLSLEKKLNKEAMERQQNMLIEQQQKALKTKEEIIELAVRREQEKKEREFRKKEKQSVLKKKQLEKELAESRNAQIAEMNKRRAIQMANNEADFKRIVDNLKKLDAIDKEKEEKRQKDRKNYREEIIKQINKRELQRREQLKNLQTEHLAWLENEKLREKNIRSVIQSKLNAMRISKMPEKYIKDVEKQLQLSIKQN